MEWNKALYRSKKEKKQLYIWFICLTDLYVYTFIINMKLYQNIHLDPPPPSTFEKILQDTCLSCTWNIWTTCIWLHISMFLTFACVVIPAILSFQRFSTDAIFPFSSFFRFNLLYVLLFLYVRIWQLYARVSRRVPIMKPITATVPRRGSKRGQAVDRDFIKWIWIIYRFIIYFFFVNQLNENVKRLTANMTNPGNSSPYVFFKEISSN